VLPRATGVSVLQVMKQVGDQAVLLADVLKQLAVFTAPADKAPLLAKAQAGVAIMQGLLASTVLGVVDTKEKAIVGAVTGTLGALFKDLSTQLASGVVPITTSDDLNTMGLSLQEAH
jgi:hypothetical protein